MSETIPPSPNPSPADAPTADPSDPDSADADSQTTGLIINVAIGVPVTLLCILVFDPLRRRIPSIFETRRLLHEERDPLDYNGNRVSTPSSPSYKFLGWLHPTLRLDLSTIADTHGLDVALFLRFHLFMLALFSVLAIPSLLLLPTYFTASNKSLPEGNDQRTIGINRFSLSNIPRDGNWRYWVVLLVEYAMVAFVCYHLFQQFTFYCRDRRRYRAAHHPANYAILVQDIPSDYRTADAVRDYWERVFPGMVATVFYVADARRLEKWKDRFWEAVDKRESAEWKLDRKERKDARRAERKASKKSKQSSGSRFGLRRRRGKHDVHAGNEGKLDDNEHIVSTKVMDITPPSSREMNEETNREQRQVQANNQDYIPPTPSAEFSQTINLSNPEISDIIPPTPSAEQSRRMVLGNESVNPDVIPPTPSAEQSQGISYGDVEIAVAALENSEATEGTNIEGNPENEKEQTGMKYPSLQAAMAAIVPGAAKRKEPKATHEASIPSFHSRADTPRSSRVIDDYADDKDAGQHFRRSQWCMPIRAKAPKRPEAAVEYWEVVQRKAWARVIAHQRMRDEGQFPVTPSAIVVFKSRRAASIAAQTNFARKENEWRASRAPEPNAIDWSALCINGWTIYVRQFITTVLGVGLTLFWIMPVTAIMSVVNLKSMAEIEIGGEKPFQFLRGLQNASPLVIGFIEGWMPALVLMLFLSFVPTLFEFFVSISRITSHAEQDRQVRDWYFVFTLCSNFLFVAFAGTLLQELQKIMKTPTETVAILARNIPKQAAFMMNFIVLTALTETPQELLQLVRVITRWAKLKYFSKTKRQREESNIGDMEMDFVGAYSTSQLIALLGLVYSTIQPFIIFCCIGYFGISYLVFKYNLCFSYYNEYEDGGRMFGGALYSVWVGLFAHLLVMVGVLGLNKSAAQSALIIIPTVISVLFILFCRKSFDRVLEHGSALETQDRIEELEGLVEDDIEPELAETYEHPGFENLPEYDEIENLNGVGGSDDEESEEDIVDIEKRAADKAWELERAASGNVRKESVRDMKPAISTADQDTDEVLARKSEDRPEERTLQAELQRVATVLNDFGRATSQPGTSGSSLPDGSNDGDFLSAHNSGQGSRPGSPGA